MDKTTQNQQIHGLLTLAAHQARTFASTLDTLLTALGVEAAEELDHGFDLDLVPVKGAGSEPGGEQGQETGRLENAAATAAAGESEHR